MMNMFDERFEFWIEELLRCNSVSTISELTTPMINDEIEETRGSIKNEKIWELGADHRQSVYHRQNIDAMNDYIDFLENLKNNKTDKHTLTLVLGIYEDPDELPIRVSFNVPENIGIKELKRELIKARDVAYSDTSESCIENAFEETLRLCCESIGNGSTCCRTRLRTLHEKENLWELSS